MHYILAGFVFIVFLFEGIISFKNYRYRNMPLAESVKDIYDEEKYLKWKSYFMEKFKFSRIQSSFTTALILILLLSNSFSKLDHYISLQVSHPILHTLSYIGMVILAYQVISMPFEYYHTFVLEADYGFNKTSHKTFFMDQAKSLGLTLVLGGSILAGIHKLLLEFDHAIFIFVLLLWAFSIFFMIVMVVLNTKVFVKIFNKLSPLEEGDLKEAIHDLANDVGFDVKKIWIMDASRRSTKLNAFFSGFGKVRDVVLFDTLVDKLSTEEILSVLAHELGHAHHKDVQKMMVRSFLIMGLYSFLFAWIYDFYGYSFAYSLILFSIISQPLNIVLGLYTNYLSRKAEYKADAFSKKYLDRRHMISALKVLARENFSNLSPHPLYVSLHYSHPTISQRVEALREANH